MSTAAELTSISAARFTLPAGMRHKLFAFKLRTQANEPFLRDTVNPLPRLPSSAPTGRRRSLPSRGDLPDLWLFVLL